MKIINKLNQVAELYDIGKIIDYKLQNGTQNKVYKVTTKDNEYIIKEYSRDAISNYYHLNKRKEQIRISEVLNKKNIKCLMPIPLTNKYFSLKNNHYYLVYKYEEYKSLNPEEVTDKYIVKLANTQANIHKLKLTSTLPCTYKTINIDFNKYLKKYKNEPDVIKVLLKNKENIENLIVKGNLYLKDLKLNLCISHNDYKHHNILWNKEDPILIDFDAVGPVNPTCALIESAYTFSKTRTRFNYDKYKLYLSSYIKEYGILKDDYEKALYLSMNGKLRWYEYLLSKKELHEIISMTNELSNFYKNIDKFKEIYNDVKLDIESNK